MSLLLDRIKVRLRVSSTAFDEGEITPLINAALAELRRVGVREDMLTYPNDGLGNETMDPMVEGAVAAYVKAMFGYDDDERQQFLDIFTRYETDMLNSATYNASYDEAAS